MEERAGRNRHQMKGGNERNREDGKEKRRKRRKNGVSVFAERESSEGDGSRKARDDARDSRHEPEGGVKDTAQEVVFASGTRQGGGEFRVRNRAAKGKNSAEEPEEKDGGGKPDDFYLESEAGKNSGSHHVGNDQRCAGNDTDFFRGGE